MKPKFKSIETKYTEERKAFFDGLKNLDRRSFLKVSAATMGAAVASGLAPRQSFQSICVAQDGGDSMSKPSFQFAYISDSHLYEKKVNDRFVRALLRAVEDVNNLDPQPDFVFYGGDLAQLGQPGELGLGAQIIRNLKAPLKICSASAFCALAVPAVRASAHTSTTRILLRISCSPPQPQALSPGASLPAPSPLSPAKGPVC